MLKKLLLLALALLLTTELVYAQVARNASIASITHTRSNFTNLSAMGLDVTGNPGYLALAGVSTKEGYQTDYYLWVSETGNLCIASWATIQTYASFPNGSWKAPQMPVCTAVGGQS